jgi:hypothetical protein
MAIVQNSYTGDGATVLFPFSFPYLSDDDVLVEVNGSLTTAFTFANANTVEFNTAPANGDSIRIYRETPSDASEAVIFAGSAIRAADLNRNNTQLLYIAQETQQGTSEANSTAANAVSIAQGAVSTANAADAKSDQAILDSSNAVATANQADANSTAAVNTANLAESNSLAAVSTANSAQSAASSAVSTANTATNTANQAAGDAAQAISTANQADSTANLALSTANQAASDASNAVSVANQADVDATNAVNTANLASSNASAAVSTANSAVVTANAAAAAVASAVLFTPIADLTALLALTPVDGDFFELNDSTGAESEPSIVGIPSGLVGDPGLTFRLTYSDPPGEFVFLSYFANNPEDRYVPINDGALTGTTTAEKLEVEEYIRLYDSTVTNYVELKAASSLSQSLSFTLPDQDGAAGQYLKTDGSGNLDWSSDITVTLIDGGNFDNGSSTVTLAQTIDGGAF